jgi:FtsP/CotA-like multicopper oxidase with cupredoxin domain
MPNASHTYEWYVTERAGPTPQDPSSIVWFYHSHVDETLDTNSGLVGAIIVSRKGVTIDADGMPNDIDREFILFLTVMNEAETHYLDASIASFLNVTPQQSTALKADADFQEANLMHNINGYLFNNVQGMVAHEEEKVRWYLMALGTEVDLHTVHWHALTTVYQGSRTDVVELLPASMATVDSVMDSLGTWMVHCHVNDHIDAGMLASYTVVKSISTTAPTTPPTAPTTAPTTSIAPTAPSAPTKGHTSKAVVTKIHYEIFLLFHTLI